MVRALVLGAALAAAALTVWQATSATSLAVPPTEAAAAAPSADATIAVDLPGLHNVVTFTNDLICGAWPEGDAGFQTLEQMGVQTVITVDGSLPDVDTAKKHDLRYVHLPIGYNGMDETRAAEIARAIRDLPKPIYIHCHHGKHRSAAAAAASCVMLGWLSPEQALAKMKIAGTAENYTGLWDAVRAACTCDPKAIEKASTSFPEQWKPSNFVETMVEIDDALDNLKLIEKAGWTVPTDHPDLVPAAEAGRLVDHFRQIGEGDYAKARPQDFRDRIAADANLLTEIEEGLLVHASASDLGAKLKKVSQSCKDCHATYRDKVPVWTRPLLDKP